MVVCHSQQLAKLNRWFVIA